MQESITITQFRNYQIDGIVRITADAKVLTLTHDEKGLQLSRVIQPQSRKFGFFVDIPVITPRGKSGTESFELKELYEFAFPEQPLPALLTRETPKNNNTATPIQAGQQQDLFE